MYLCDEQVDSIGGAKAWTMEVAGGDWPDLMAQVLYEVGEQEQAERVRRYYESLAYVAPVVSRPAERVVTTGDCEGIPSWFPAEIAWRESRCTRGIDTGNGYLGYAQIARFHWDNLCVGLDWTDESQYDECVALLWNGGAGARHWGG